MSSINIRTAEKKDLPELLEIYNHVIANTTAVYSYDPHTIEMREAWFEERTKNNFPVFVTVENETIVGFASYGSFRIWKIPFMCTMNIAAKGLQKNYCRH